MIPMSARTLTVFSILGFSFSCDHQKSLCAHSRWVPQTLTQERFGATTGAVSLARKTAASLLESSSVEGDFTPVTMSP